MTFPYWQVHLDGEPRLIPLIPLTLHGPSTSVDLLALIDSGAEHNVFGEEIAQRLSLDLEDATPVTIVGIGEQDRSGRLITVDLQLGKHRWTAPTIFSPALGQRLLLGQAGFFAFFNVYFRRRHGNMEIRRAR